MGMWQRASPDAEKRLLELAGLFAACREAFFDIGQGEFHLVPDVEGARSITLLPARVILGSRREPMGLPCRLAEAGLVRT